MTLHFITVNLAVGGPMLALWLDRRSRRGDAAADLLGRSMLRIGLLGMYAGGALGVVAAYLWWSAAPTAVERAFRSLPRSRYEFGLAEFVFSAICFEVWRRLWTNDGRRWRRTGWWLGLAATTNVAYHFPTLFAGLSVLSTRPTQAGGTVRFVSLLVDAEVLARTAHFLVASVAVAGTVLSWLAAQASPRQSTDDSAKTNPTTAAELLRRRGSQIALFATLLQWPIGIGVLLTLPDRSRDGLLGDDLTTAAMFGISLGAVVVLMHRLAAAAFGRVSRREASVTLAWLGMTIIFMTAVRHYARQPLYPAAAVGIIQPSTLEPCSATFRIAS